jgi:tetratricopeptide (TPR) repeat protein
VSAHINPGRNEPCPCGSQRRYKACCGRLADGWPAPPHPLALPQELQAAELARLTGLLESARYAELESVTRELLDRRPQSASLWQLLGVARARQDKDPLSALDMAVRCAPEDAAAHLNLGNAFGRLGRLEDAAASYRRALDADPEFAEAHNNLGELSLECGRADEALLSYQQALRIRPDFAHAHQNLGKALVRLGRFEEAVQSCRRAIAISPGLTEAHNTLGSALVGLARPQEAIASFQRALGIDPDFAEAHANLARALRSIGRLDDAVAAYRRALLLKPDLILARTELATALRLQRLTDEAEQSCRKALQAHPDFAAAVVVLAELRADAGQFAEAEELFRRALAIDPALPEAWLGLTRVRRMTPADDAWLAAMQRLVAQDLPPQRELLLRFAIGKYFDDVGYYGQAFRSYQRANELAKRCGPSHRRQNLSGTMDLIMRSYDGPWINRQRAAVHRSARPVFIVGMLRSGTTLAEQILASHPQVYGAGELPFWSEVAAAAFSKASSADLSATRVSDSTVADLGDRYLRVLRGLSPGALRVVDKLPTNFLFLGLIRAALPGARIIHLLRHPIDTCLSIYFQHFEAANTYANDLEDLAHYYSQYWRLMKHWRSVLPEDAILEVPYEELVADLPRWTRRMLEFIGVPWDERCLDFDRTARPVVTASKWQVRQKLFNSSVGRWRHYEPFVAPLTSLLELTP